ncbi:hypothetical protein [Glutamicibacter sp.]|uniref:hypothetical protein n=1 Tax=Glutamicibacter sp. TaxID=1931995 RepID=UPI0028BDED7A|nr:hypothetical protein [Glutamicibacter sp.]
MGTIPLGEDILLARHGANIVKLRQNRKQRTTIAYLRDGETDSASNVITLTSVTTPAANISRSAEKYLNDEAEISRAEVRSLVKISLGFSAVLGTIFGGLLLALYKIGGPEAMNSLANLPMQ